MRTRVFSKTWDVLKDRGLRRFTRLQTNLCELSNNSEKKLRRETCVYVTPTFSLPVR